MTHEPDHFTPEAVEEQLDQVAQQLRERDPALAESPTLHVVADLQHLYDQQARAETEAWQRVRQRLLRTDAAARYLRQAQAQPTGKSSVQQPWRTLGQQGGRLGQHGVAPVQLSQRRNGPHTRPGIRQERRDRLPPIFRAGQRWSARAMTLVAALLLVVLVGGLTLGLILVHRANSGTPVVTIQEFALPTPCGANGCGPTGITSGPDGNLWFTEAGGNTIGRITPSGSITEFPIPMANNSPHGITNSSPFGITSGPDDNLWFTEQAGNTIGRITPAGTIQEFPLPTTCNNQHPCGPTGITSGSDGNLWFTEQYVSKIGRISP